MIRVLRFAALALALALAMAMSASAAAHAQGGILFQGLVDLEVWKTDSGSTLLTRNHGHPGGVLRVQLWSAVEPWRGIFLFAQGQVEGGNAQAFNDRRTETSLDQGGIRLARDPRFVVNIGRMFHPVGTFGPRVLSTRNPLIGIPDTYSEVYPLGAMVSGEMGRVDYRAGAVSLPLTHRDYVPPADAALRPVVGVGVTPFTGFRLGASATVGPYLNGDLASTQTAGRSWKSYHQTLIAPELAIGVEHFDLRAEYDYAKYDVPTVGSVVGHAGYVEGRYTVSPRLFVAVRSEMNHYPFIRPVGTTLWIARRTDFSDWEGGVGFRATESTLFKASYRADNWVVTAANAAFVRPGGRALAVQLSQSFDVMDWVSAVRTRY